jgi:hypothetical protein
MEVDRNCRAQWSRPRLTGTTCWTGRSLRRFIATLVGVKPTDQIWIPGSALRLTGGIQWIGSESPWAVGLGGVRYGIDVDGELVIKDVIGQQMFVANYVGGPGVPYDQDTAGIYVARVKFEGMRLLDPGFPSNWQATQFQLVNALAKAYLGIPIYHGYDPIVFDLTGEGINLTATSSVAPTFDMNNTGFAVHTGWVEPNVGILVIQNADGTIENASNFVGANGNSGFAALAQYDANGDGVIDANDPAFSQLFIWQDSNGNGVVDAGELLTPQQAGITSIDVASTAPTTTPATPGSPGVSDTCDRS